MKKISILALSSLLVLGLLGCGSKEDPAAATSKTGEAATGAAAGKAGAPDASQTGVESVKIGQGGTR
jgi:hypothetical protein